MIFRVDFWDFQDFAKSHGRWRTPVAAAAAAAKEFVVMSNGGAGGKGGEGEGEEERQNGYEKAQRKRKATENGL